MCVFLLLRRTTSKRKEDDQDPGGKTSCATLRRSGYTATRIVQSMMQTLKASLKNIQDETVRMLVTGWSDGSGYSADRCNKVAQHIE